MSLIPDRPGAVPLTSSLVFAATLCAVGFGIDLMEVSVGNALSAVFSAAPYSLSPRTLAKLLSSVYVGAVIGALLLGMTAERRGLRWTLTGTLLWLGVTSFLAAACSSPGRLALFRLLSGVALGGYPPLMIAYLTAIAPARRRGVIIFWVCGAAYLAPPVAIFMIRWLTPLHPFGIEGWRWPFALAGVSSLLVGAAFSRLPEVVAKRAARAASAVPATHQVRRRFAFVAALYFLHPWAVSAFPLLTGPILLARGYNLTDTLLYIGLATFGPALSTFAVGPMVDRVGRRISLSLCYALMLLSVVIFFTTVGAVLLTISVVSFSVGVALYSAVMTMYGAELFPAAVRARATSGAWAGNRIASMLVPIVMLPVLHFAGPSTVAVIISAVLIGTILFITLFGPPGAAGQVVE